MARSWDGGVIFVFSNLTFPPGEGLHFQSTALIKELRSFGVPVGVVTFVRSSTAFDQAAFARWAGGLEFVDVIPSRLNYPLLLLRNLVLGWVPSALSRAMKTRFKAWPTAAVHMEGIGLAPLVGLCRAHGNVISTVDAWSLRQRRLAAQASGVKRLFLTAYAKLSELAERRFFPQASAVHVVSAADAGYLGAVAPKARVVPIPVALIDIPKATQRPLWNASCAPTVVFWGDIGVPHLRMGLEWLFTKVVPHLASQNLQINWVIVGRREPDDALRKLATGARFIGWVDSVEAVFSEAAVVVLPDKSGTGLKNRALHAMACGVPVIGSSYAFEGIPVTDGVEALVRDTPVAFSEGLFELLHAPQLCDAVGARGRAFVLNGYGMDAVTNSWLALYQSLGTPTSRQTS